MRNFIQIFFLFLLLGFPLELQAEPHYRVLYTFPEVQSEMRSAPLLASDGFYYGAVSRSSDSEDPGQIYRLKPNGEFDYIVSLEDTGIGRRTVMPFIQAQDKALYGVSAEGGEFNAGTVFKYSLGGEAQVLHSFNSNDGLHPSSALLEVSKGIFWGTTLHGGDQSFGTIYQINSEGEFKVLYRFNGIEGSGPTGGLVRHSNGHFYGVTKRGGDEDVGVLFRMSRSQQYKVITSFLGEDTRVIGGLTLAGDGLVYGVLQDSKAARLSSIFKIDAHDQFSTHFAFPESDDIRPLGPLLRGRNGYLYGLARKVGTKETHIYETHTDGRFSIIKSFDESVGFGYGYRLIQFNENTLMIWVRRRHLQTTSFTKTYPFVFGLDDTVAEGKFLFDKRGAEPSSPLMRGTDSKFYGVTFSGGDKVADNGIDLGLGTIYRFDLNSRELVTLHCFSESEGRNPSGELIETEPGIFFGVAQRGGENKRGVVYRFNRHSKNLKVIHSFSGSDGQSPTFGLTLAENGLLYGTTPNGRGEAHLGSLFTINPKNERLEETYLMKGLGAEASVSSKLLSASDGLLYGTTASTRKSDWGELIRYNIETGEMTVLHDFDGTLGRNPKSSLIETGDGFFYGTASTGGEFDNGTLFKFKAGSDPISIYSFPEAIEAFEGHPLFKLVQGRSGVLFGLTQSPAGQSSLFQYDLREGYQRLHEFNLLTGATPAGSLLQLEEGGYLGSTQSGGLGGRGVIYKISGIDDLLAFKRGDSNSNGIHEIADALLLLEFLFLGGDHLKCWDAADADDDGDLAISDAVLVLHHLFLGGEFNGELCAQDQTQDLLSCQEVNLSCDK